MTTTTAAANRIAWKLADRRHRHARLLLSSTLSILPDPFAEVATGVIDFFTGGAASKAIDRKIASLQREYEKLSLALAATEATQSAVVAGRQLGVARQGLVVAGMQRAAAVLRHEFALQNLTFLRNRTLNAELWCRLSGALRGVADTYLRYAVELAFLAEQAYEFEADKRIDVIRFDYDVSDLGDMLAGDFLLRDLDTLEQDLIVGQRNRQQQVRYVLSLAREYPEALQQLREDGHTIFSLRLEQIERRFPGLFNVRVAAVDVLPLALMDNSRFSLELTHLGTGQVRLKADPTTPETAPDWLSSDDWSVRHRVLGPESAVYSGLSKQELAQGTFASTQRGAFEGRPGASMWRIDMSMRENRVVPDTLADVVLTFTLTGYHDATLRAANDRAPERDVATTLWSSARQLFPDSYYQFHQTTKLEWEVSPDSLALQGSVGELQNSPPPSPVHRSTSFRRSTLPPNHSRRIDGKPPAASGAFPLQPGRHVLQLLATRPLRARFHSQQRFEPGASLTLDALRLATNRTFDVITGTETTTTLDAFGQHVFGAGPLSPFDRWTFELPLADNPCLVSVSSSDILQPDLGEISDVFLSLEIAQL